MQIDRLRSWVEILANVGVLIGICFLVYELNQNNVNQRLEAKLALSERFSEFDGGPAENEDLAALIVKADLEGAELNPVERVRYRAHYNRWMSILMRVQALYEDGVLDDSDWQEYVCEARKFYLVSASFRSFVDGVRKDYLTEELYVALSERTACDA